HCRCSLHEIRGARDVRYRACEDQTCDREGDCLENPSIRSALATTAEDLDERGPAAEPLRCRCSRTHPLRDQSLCRNNGAVRRLRVHCSFILTLAMLGCVYCSSL